MSQLVKCVGTGIWFAVALAQFPALLKIKRIHGDPLLLSSTTIFTIALLGILWLSTIYNSTRSTKNRPPVQIYSTKDITYFDSIAAR